MKKKNLKILIDTKVKELLLTFGLSENQSAVYVASLQLGNTLVKDIAKNARLNRTTTYNILLELRRLGLVSSYQKQNLTHFSASPPSSLQDLINKRINEQQLLKSQLDEFLPILNGLFHSQGRGSSVKMYEGLSSVAEIYRAVYRNVKYPTQGLEFTNWGGKYEIFPATIRQEFMDQFEKNNIVSRSLLIEDELTKSWVAKDSGKSQHKIIKLLPNPGWDFFCNLELCENRFAVVTYKDEVDFQGLVIESTELSSMFRFMFESLWSSIK